MARLNNKKLSLDICKNSKKAKVFGQNVSLYKL